MSGALAAMERHQVGLYLLALGVGAGLGLAAPGLAAPVGALIEPSLVALLLVTFLGIPLTRLGPALGDARFLVALLLVNGAAVPVLAALLTIPLRDHPALLVGALLVLLAPCIDYVLVFVGIAGGDRTRLLAATPALMVLQMVMIPVLLPLLAAGEAVSGIAPAPFVRALLLMIVLPLVLAALLQRSAPRLGAGLERLMVPLMMLVLSTVVCSQIGAVGAEARQLARLVPLYAAFAVLAAAVGWLLTRAMRLDRPGGTAVTLSGATRNSLVVLPLALALPAPLGLAPLAVITQTLVELLMLLLLVQVLPRLPWGRLPWRAPATKE